jgi:S1-C subfamily serine protease
MYARQVAAGFLMLSAFALGWPTPGRVQAPPAEKEPSKVKAKAAPPKAVGKTPSTKSAVKPRPIPPPKLAVTALTSARQLEAAAKRCDTAPEAVRLYQLFVADTRVPAAERESAKAGLEPWQQRVEQKLVRLGPKWVSIDERKELREEADTLIREAFVLLGRVTFEDVAGGAGKTKASVDAAVAKIEQAKKTFPDGIYEDFLLGFTSAAYAHDAAKAQKQFAECVKQDPEHVSALNNLAVAYVRLKKYSDAYKLWKLALQTSPGSPEIAQNIGRLIRQYELSRAKINKTAASQLEQLQADIATFGAANFDPKAGWIYMSFYESPLKVGAAVVAHDTVAPGAWKKAALEKSEKSDGATTSSAETTKPRMIVGTGAGLVVHPKYVVTNRHLVLTADGASIATADATRRLPAEIVAVSDAHDLALLKCDALAAPAVPLAKEFPKIGGQITLFGFPLIERIGAAPQATKGQVVTLPDAATAQTSILSADLHPSSTGGPVIDAAGAVVAILSAPEHGELSSYACGVPAALVREFVASHIKDFKEPAPVNNPEAVAKSTVLVFVEKEAVRPPTATAAASGGPLAGVLFHDPWCVACDGGPSPKCTAPKCNKGRVIRIDEKLVSDGFKSKTIKVKTEVPCPVCTGLGVQRCVRCLGKGIDPDITGY